jgi:hypothetical protein
MAVQRKSPSMSVIGSFLMVITAGTLYRIGRMNKKVVKMQLNTLL